MFVQSHIQRHHNHNHHHHNHSHSQFRPQQPLPGHDKHHHPHRDTRVTSASQRRSVYSNDSAALCALTRSTTASAALVPGANEQVIGNGRGVIEQKPTEAPTRCAPSTTPICKSNITANQDQSASINASRAGDWDCDCDESCESLGRWIKQSSAEARVQPALESDWPTSRRRDSLKDKTRSLGSHESLKVYDLMPRNTRVVPVHTATGSTTTTSYCGPNLSGRHLAGAEHSPSAERFGFVEPIRAHYSCRRLEEHDEPRRVQESVAVGSTLQRKFLAGSQQLLGAILDLPWLLTGKLLSSIELNNISDSNNRSQHSIELLRSFCMSFIRYQLETWRLLADDLAKERHSLAHYSSPRDNNELAGPLIKGFWRENSRASAHLEGGNGPKRAATRSGRVEHHSGQLKGRNFHSLDRPILERQREVVLDEEEDGDDGREPIIRIPQILREPQPRQPSQAAMTTPIMRHHSHRHTHRHDSNHTCPIEQVRVELPPLPPPLIQSNFVGVSGYPMGSSRQGNSRISRGPAKYASQNEEPLIGATSQRFATVQSVHGGRGKSLHLGQHSLDCDHLQAASLSAGNHNHGPPLSRREGNKFLNQNCYRDDESWDDRPFSDEDFRSNSNSCQAKSYDKSTDGKCDHNETIQGNMSLLSKGLSDARKRRSMKKSSSPLSFEGARRRLGLKLRSDTSQLSSISVIRSEEVIPTEVRHLSRQTTFNSLYDSGTESGSFWRGQSLFSPDPRANFVEGIGMGQIASRQALVSPYLGDIQLSLSSRRGMLEVEVIRARGLHAKAGAKSSPSPYVKVYLMKGKKCIAKCRTHQVERTLDPLYQEPFVFRNEFKNCVLQVIVWGDYGKRDRKSMMGIVQIRLDDLDISNVVIGWYRLFNIPSMTNSLVSSKNLRQKLLHSSSIGESPMNR